MRNEVTDITGRFSSVAPRPADVLPGAAFDPWHVRVLSQKEFSDLAAGKDGLNELQLTYLSWFGSLAPTAHNTVPQRFVLSPESREIEVWLDRKFTLVESDACGRQATISCGCAITYLALAADAYGWRAQVQVPNVDATRTRPLTDGAPRYTELARVRFQPKELDVHSAQWLTAMIARKSMRVDYDPGIEIGEELIEDLRFTISKYPNTKMHLITDAVTLGMLGKFQELADTTVYNRESFARELGHWLLQNDDRSPIGMRGCEFGLSDEVATHMHKGLCGDEPLLPDEIAAFAKSSSRAIRSASAVVVLSTKLDSVEGRLEAGRAFGELALVLQRHEFSSAVHAAIVEVEPANLALRARLRTSHRPTVVFRMGRPAKTAHQFRSHSSRPPISDLLISNSSKPNP